MLQEVANFVNVNLMSSAMIVGLLLESALRMFPTDKPKSIILAVSAIVHTIADIVAGVAKFLDKVIPQNLK